MERVGELGGDDKLDTEKNLGKTEKSLRCVLRCQAKRFLTNASFFLVLPFCVGSG